ncbi:amino acid ABC transporter permease [Brevibacillus fluminis]|uniref:Amino acid ABC transporter permease n=1 Tax=Brevibacillus fluminis TaxID=511487 RepID=A0A3M8DW51_9BACL|nr:amino acid ABC transporter permease [Brevibacillus fluminis]RNB92400.1 amino acid ABC transporter permease [Brevibacillus fluminis]
MDTLNIIQKALPALLSGLWVTLEIAVVALFFAMAIGLAFGLLRISKNPLLRWIAEFYVNIIRGTPLLVQVLFIYFGLPGAFDFKLSAFAAGVIAISINAGAYLVEIFRAGIESIDRGQMEAGRALGFTYAQTMNYVILPQAVKRMIPAFVNQFIITIKDTSLLSVIGIAELTMEGQTIYSSNFRAFEILGAIAVIYYILIYALTLISNRLERRLAKS